MPLLTPLRGWPRDSGYQPIAVTCLEGARDARGD